MIVNKVLKSNNINDRITKYIYKEFKTFLPNNVHEI